METSVTTIGHAETRRLWQGREFWERADAALGAGGALLARHDAYRRASAAAPPQQGRPADRTAQAGEAGDTRAAAGPAVAVLVTLAWNNGLVTRLRLGETCTASGPGQPGPELGLRHEEFHLGLLTACSALLAAAQAGPPAE